MNSNSFVEKWKVNGEDLIKQGIYEWATDMLTPKYYKRILEIGCGTGHSTLILVITEHQVFSIDISDECVKAACELLSSDWDAEIVDDFKMSDDKDATFVTVDIFDDDTFSKLKNLEIDAIVIWNPGQTDDTIKLIDRCVCLAKIMNVPIQVLERTTDKDHGEQMFKEIAYEHHIRLITDDYMEVRWNQEEGIRLNIHGNNVCFSLGLFFPY